VYIEFLHVDSFLGKLTNVHKVTMNGSRSGHGGADQVGASASALTAFEVAIAGASATLAGL
jgi:hypothetical protein